LGGGVLRDLGCHGIDIIGFITGATGFAVQESRIAWDGQTDRQVSARFSITGTGANANGECPVEFTVSWLSRQANTIELHFENASVRCGIKPDAKIHIASDRTFKDLIEVNFSEAGARSPYQSYFLEWDAVLRALRDNGDSDFNAAGGLWTTSLVEALYEEGGAV
jgi:predicted dehydrogenase